MRRLTFSVDSWQGRSLPITSSSTSTTHNQASREDRPQCYTTNVPAALLSQQSDLIEQLMGFARTLGARRLEVFVRDAE